MIAIVLSLLLSLANASTSSCQDIENSGLRSSVSSRLSAACQELATICNESPHHVLCNEDDETLSSDEKALQNRKHEFLDSLDAVVSYFIPNEKFTDLSATAKRDYYQRMKLLNELSQSEDRIVVYTISHLLGQLQFQWSYKYSERIQSQLAYQSDVLSSAQIIGLATALGIYTRELEPKFAKKIIDSKLFTRLFPAKTLLSLFGMAALPSASNMYDLATKDYSFTDVLLSPAHLVRFKNERYSENYVNDASDNIIVAAINDSKQLFKEQLSVGIFAAGFFISSSNVAAINFAKNVADKLAKGMKWTKFSLAGLVISLAVVESIDFGLERADKAIRLGELEEKVTELLPKSNLTIDDQSQLNLALDSLEVFYFNDLPKKLDSYKRVINALRENDSIELEMEARRQNLINTMLFNWMNDRDGQEFRSEAVSPIRGLICGVWNWQRDFDRDVLNQFKTLYYAKESNPRYLREITELQDRYQVASLEYTNELNQMIPLIKENKKLLELIKNRISLVQTNNRSLQTYFSLFKNRIRDIIFNYINSEISEITLQPIEQRRGLQNNLQSQWQCSSLKGVIL